MKQLSRVLSIILIWCLTFSLTACGTSTSTPDTGTDSGTNETEKQEVKYFTDDELEDIAVNAVIDELSRDNRYSYYCKQLDYYNIDDLQYWKYKIATIDRNVDSYNFSDNVHVVYGKLYAYNKYEDITGGPYYFRVLIMSEKRPDWAGTIRDCEIAKKETSFQRL